MQDMFVPLISNLRAFTFGPHEKDDDDIPKYPDCGQKLLSKDQEEEVYFTLDLQAFTCKPATKTLPL